MNRGIFAWSRDYLWAPPYYLKENAAIRNRKLELRESIRKYVEEGKSHSSKIIS